MSLLRREAGSLLPYDGTIVPSVYSFGTMVPNDGWYVSAYRSNKELVPFQRWSRTMHPKRIARSIPSMGFLSSLFTLVGLGCLGCTTLRNAGCDEILSVRQDGLEQSEGHENKGVKLFDKGKLQSAAEEFQRAISFQHENGAAHNNLGLVYFQQRKMSEAAKEFETAAQFLPEDPTPWNNLGMTLEAAGRGQEAIEYYQHAYELAPAKPLYLGNLVRTRIRLGENDESVTAQLKELLFMETRPEWVAWATDQLALEMNPMLDRGPPPPNLNSKSKGSEKDVRPQSFLPSATGQMAPIVNGDGERVFLGPAFPQQP